MADVLASLPGDDVTWCLQGCLQRARTVLLARANSDHRDFIAWLAIYAAQRATDELVVRFFYSYEEWQNCQSGSDLGDHIVMAGRATLRAETFELLAHQVWQEATEHFGEWEHDHGGYDSRVLLRAVRQRLEANAADGK